MRFFLCAMAVSAAALAGAVGGSAEYNPVRTQPQQQFAAQQIIVKLRSADESLAVTPAARTVKARQRVANIAARVGLTLQEVRPITERLHVLTYESASAGSLDTTLARLRADADVEYAEPDQRRYIHAIPNDTLYPQVGPLNSGQWYLQNDPATPAAVNAIAAWDVTRGGGVVIADLDTGVRFDHPDLLAVAASGRLLPGYDFITNDAVANDGEPGRDPDASDPGDWVTTADTNTSQFKSCKTGNSSWHGTRTAGILGALTDNAQGIAGMTWSGNILPVRVLGKCGGFDSDIIAAMLWAAGISVAGVPDNTHPAKIINMSLGAPGTTCPSDYTDTISQVMAKGVLVVVSAGNEGGPVAIPANCPGVAGVAGIRQLGTKVGFSSLGPQITVAAPAGNCVNTGPFTPTSPCEYPIETTTNSGTTVPAANGYTDQVNDPNLGTSFSAPIVSGIAALMSSVNSGLGTCQLIARLKEGSKAFPQTSTTLPAPPACHVPASSTDLQTSECICTTDGKTCGAGMANAAGAIAAALRPVAAVTLPSSVSPGQSISLGAQGSFAANGHTISAYQWTNTGAQAAAIQNGASATPTVTAPSCGYATVQLTVTDDAGKEDVATVVLSPTAATSTAAVSASSSACSSSAPAILLAVCPAASSVQAGSGTQAFTASVANTTDNSVTWEVNNIVGGNATVGTITSTGVYTAPPNVPSPATVTIEAVSAVDQNVTSSTQVTITAPPKSGGGAMDPLTLVVEALALGLGLISRRLSDSQKSPYASLCAASSQDFCARR